MAKPAVVVVGADKGGVGKTTVSRTLLDYFSANNGQTRAFDTQHPRRTLKRFHSEVNEMAFEQVEIASVPFLKFVANKGVHDEAANYSFVLRGYVRHWLANVWSEFDRIKLTDIVGSGKAAVRSGGEK